MLAMDERIKERNWKGEGGKRTSTGLFDDLRPLLRGDIDAAHDGCWELKL